MKIQRELCNECGLCVKECYKTAIGKNEAGKHVIDPDLCNDCKEVFEIECIRVCKPEAITKMDGTVPEFDPTPRIRTRHLSTMINIMGDRGKSDRFPMGHHEWDSFRKLISAAFLNPKLNIRLSKVFDDICIGCDRKQEPGHSDVTRQEDEACFEKLGVEPGAVMNFWDAVQLVEDKYSIKFLKKWHPDDYIDCFINFVSPHAKVLANPD